MRSSDLAGRRVLLLGTGREAIAAAVALAPVVSELVAADDTDGESAAAFRGAHGPVLIAPDFDSIAGRFDVVVKSPGISPGHPLVVALLAAGVPLTSGTDLWMTEHASTTTGVTGSKGKSTTASLVHHLNVAFGIDSALGGNIGVPLLALAPADRTVAELSSYQAQSLTISPDVVVLTSLFPDHLDWHGSEQQYFADKLNAIAHGPRVVITNVEDARLVAVLRSLGHEPVGSAWRVDGDVIVRGDEPFMPRSELRMLGRHNAVNATLALAAVEAAGVTVDPGIARRALAAFAPLEHRLEPIADPSGITFINDSLSTTPHAAIAALEAIGTAGVVLIVGGQDRGVDYGVLREYLAARPVTAALGLPPSGPRILEEIARTGIPTEPVDDMVHAVSRARALAPANGIVLLSPAAPSYGVYRDFADRADAFRAAIVQTS